MSASDGLFVTVLGAGGHGSAPHAAKDPVTAAAEMVMALQAMITRQFNMFDPVVLTVGLLQAGTKRNVIPETARFEATIRTFSDATRERMKTSVPRLLRASPPPTAWRSTSTTARSTRSPSPTKTSRTRPRRPSEPVRRPGSPAGPPRSRLRGLLPGPGRSARHFSAPAVAPGRDQRPHRSTTHRLPSLTTPSCPTEPHFTQLAVSRIASPAPPAINHPRPLPGDYHDRPRQALGRSPGSQAPPADPHRHRHRQRRRMVRLGHLCHVRVLHCHPLFSKADPRQRSSPPWRSSPSALSPARSAASSSAGSATR